MSRLRHLAIWLLDRIDHHILDHRWYWLCRRIGLSSWWGPLAVAAPALQPLWSVVDLAAHFRVSRAQAYRLGRLIPRATPRGTHPRWDPDTVRSWQRGNEGHRTWASSTAARAHPITGPGGKTPTAPSAARSPGDPDA